MPNSSLFPILPGIISSTILVFHMIKIDYIVHRRSAYTLPTKKECESQSYKLANVMNFDVAEMCVNMHFLHVWYIVLEKIE